MRRAKKGDIVNASSMADIAFLLLIFFLVTTKIELETGISQNLPKISEEPPQPVNERNILRVFVNLNNELLVENEIVRIQDLSEIVKQFVDNKGALDHLSISPQFALVSLNTDKATSYERYLSVLNEVKKAYFQLRSQEVKNRRRLADLEISTYQQLEAAVKQSKDEHNTGKYAELKEHKDQIRKLYPMLISEEEPFEIPD